MLGVTLTWLSISLGVISVSIVLIGLLGGAFAYFRQSSGKNLLAQQDWNINQLNSRVAEQDRQIQQLRQQNGEQAQQIKALQELVTQAAKVDALTTLVRTGFGKLGAQV